jgi:tetratricopeptide (TPR) repeat protein
MSIRSYTTLNLFLDLAASLASAEKAFGTNSEEAATIVRPLFFLYIKSGNAKEGITCALRLKLHYEQTGNANGADYLVLLSRIAKLYAHEGQWDNAAAQYASLIALNKESEDTTGELQATLQLAHCYIQSKQHREAASLLYQYIDRQGPMLVQAYAYLAQACAHFDRAQAQAALEKQQEIIEDRGPDPYELFTENALPSIALLCATGESMLGLHA